MKGQGKWQLGWEIVSDEIPALLLLYLDHSPSLPRAHFLCTRTRSLSLSSSSRPPSPVVVVVVVVAVVVGNILVDGSYAGLANQFVAASTTVAVQMPVEARLKDRLRQHQTKRSFAAAKDSFARSQFVPIAFVVALFPSAAAEKKTPRP